MNKIKFFRKTWNNYFDRLKSMALLIEDLRKITNEIDNKILQKKIRMNLILLNVD